MSRSRDRVRGSLWASNSRRRRRSLWLATARDVVVIELQDDGVQRRGDAQWSLQRAPLQHGAQFQREA